MDAAVVAPCFIEHCYWGLVQPWEQPREAGIQLRILQRREWGSGDLPGASIAQTAPSLMLPALYRFPEPRATRPSCWLWLQPTSWAPAPPRMGSGGSHLTSRVNRCGRSTGDSSQVVNRPCSRAPGPQHNKAECALRHQRQDVLERGCTIVVVKRKRN